MSLYSREHIDRVIEQNRDWIHHVAARYRMPSAAILSVLRLEMERIDVFDLAADFVVSSQVFSKKDSSTGPMQVFGRTGVHAVNFAVDRGLTSYSALGFRVDHRLDERNIADVHLIWSRLHRDVHANIEIAALNLLCCAHEMTGCLDFDSFSAVNLKLIFTRYNQDIRSITAYGETAYRYYLFYLRR